ncbi:helix-turn-helix transcriptional regulator [Enterovibrio norvegicus]|uniref:helix-turn-helix domain-containing protein n=1 Tax=Enterovibrio norvegicus TaxID=188144 RepID=UPI0010BECB5A|nr:helix-turn-helix domain-containing protein [Enterovibrio norvegicus]TKF08230.1 helix-turn-helix transcriptional regulator [Enterovibrio norvegicus]
MIDITFCRMAYIKPLINGVMQVYRLNISQIGIPHSLYADDMALIPHSEINRWLRTIVTLTGERHFPFRIAEFLDVANIHVCANWLTSAPDLSITFRRINYGMSCFHSSGHYVGRQSGHILKWCYHNAFTEDVTDVDALRVAIMFTQVLRHFSSPAVDTSNDGTTNGFQRQGKSKTPPYSPLMVRLAGTNIDVEEAEAWFGCQVISGCEQTEVWFDTKLLLLEHTTSIEENREAVLSLNELDELVNMPQRDDPTKALYEVVSYARYYGMPTVEHVANLLALSPQQLQRRLQKLGFSFTSILAYVLNNIAVRYLLKGYAPDDIAQLLGYTNPQSFIKAFKRVRGCTPNEYLRHLNL